MKIEGKTIIADEGKTFIRLRDGFDMDNRIDLGYDLDEQGNIREDKPEYYKEVLTNND
jgi:hypothetical protein